MKLISILFSWCLRRCLALRYRVHVKGLDKLFADKMHRKRGILFLPNHPAEVDPVLVESLLMSRFRPRPLIVEHFYYLPGGKPFFNVVRGIPIPNFETTANQWKIKKAKLIFEEVKQGLAKKDNFLIYPAGHLRRTPKEIIGGSSFVHNLIQECPDIQIVLVRTTGLWGSMFSRALTGQLPDFWKMLMKGIKIIFKNGIFFVPKRDITVEFETVTHDIPKKGTRLIFNQYLEEWYNHYPGPEEPVKLVSYSFFKTDLPKILEHQKKDKEKSELKIPEKVRNDIYSKLSELSGFPKTQIHEDMDLSIDLGLDSLDIAGLFAFLDQKYGIEEIAPGELTSVYDLLELALEEKTTDSKSAAKDLAEAVWPEEKKRPDPIPPQGKTIPETFLHICKKMDGYVACADNVSSVLSYKRMKLAVIIFSRKIKEYPGEHIGIMLPASCGAYITILATLFAGKIPVILNWTAGVRTLDHAAGLVNLQTVFSSRRFLDRVDNLDLGTIEEKLVLLEDLKKNISFWDKIKALFLSKKSPKALLKKFQLDKVIADDPAVLLFTSGTESYPKAVPLSHHNLICNQRASLLSIDLHGNDIMYGVLPPFHSFGFSVTGLFPLLSGLRVFYAPDPTDSHGMARDLAHWKITMICCAPSFYKNLFRVTTPEQLYTVRYFVSGAEKASDDLREFVNKLDHDAIFFEGYGITECAPLVTICRPHLPIKGVGQPVPGVEISIVHPETQELLTNNQEGEVCIKGPNVFKGYYGDVKKDPFIELYGEKWYRSGDIGLLDDDGYLIIKGRFSRFIKIGAEMVSLTALEEELYADMHKRKWHIPDDGMPCLAVSPIERESEKTTLILYTTFQISKEEVNGALRESGFGRIIKISEVRQIDEIPLTGTGKVHFRVLDEKARKA